MKRCILVGVRTNKDEKTGDDLLFLSLVRLASRMKDGGLWHPKKDELYVTACINKSRKPDEYAKYSKLIPGTLIDVVFGVNDYTGKVVVASIDVVPGTDVFDEETVYV